MSAEKVILGIGVLILTAGISFYFLRQRYRNKPVQWRGGIPVSGISQMLFLGGLLSVAIGALTGAIALFAIIFIILFIFGWLSQSRDRISYYRATGHVFDRSRQILFAFLPAIMLLMFFSAPFLGHRHVLGLNASGWFLVVFPIYIVLLIFIGSKPRKIKKSSGSHN